MLPGILGAMQGAGYGVRPLEWAKENFIFSQVDASTYNFSSVPTGTAPGAGERRYIVVAAAAQHDSAARTLSSISIGGSTATIAKTAESGPGLTVCALAYAEVATGTTTTVDLVYSNTMRHVCFTIYRVITGPGGMAHGGTSESITPGATMSIDVGYGSSIAAVCQGWNVGTWTWTGLDEDSEFDIQTNEYMASANRSFESFHTADFDADSALSGSDEIIIASEFHPA